ncbi:uncharacterized protein LOC135335665 [Halichondria panicea]|uniref:uncharacterized protein LOC135335665 n=1 Tax=Halichondria panicea TaxID=6063 RepID=UPI00312B9D90
MALSARSSVSLGHRLMKALGSFAPKHSGHEKLGLLLDDIQNEEDPAVKEAVRRLPEEDSYARLYRIKRALDLSIKGAQLPKEQWITPGSDVPYLLPTIIQVEAELKEKKAWNRQ